MTLEISQHQSQSQFQPQLHRNHVKPGPGPWIYINGYPGRSSVLTAITSSQKGLETPYIFTGAHTTSSFNPISSLIATQHATHAAQHGVPFISVLLACEEAEHLQRATSLERVPGKLTDLQKLREIRRLGLFSFRDEEVSIREVRIDVTGLSAGGAAVAVLEFVKEELNPFSVSD